MINLARPQRTSIRNVVCALFDRFVRQRTDAYALIAALLSIGALAVIH